MRKTAIMQRQKRAHRTLTFLTALTLALAFTSLRPDAAPADSGKDFVIVIDVSTSMTDVFDDVKEFSKRTIGRASVGDNVTVITFGEQATLLDRKQIRGKADLVSLQNSVEELYPTDYATYINSGLEKGLSELRYLFDRNPDRERVLLWLSDDKDNPPEALGNDYITLDKLKDENTDFEPGSEWFEYDAPLSETESQNIEDFVMWARRATFRVVVKEPSVDFGSFEDGNVQKEVTLTFDPLHPGAAGLDFLVSGRLVNTNDPSQKITAEVTPQRVRSSGQMWKQKFQVTFTADPGEYSGVIAFRSIAGTALELVPSAVSFKVSIIPPKLEPEEPAGPPVEKTRPKGLLADAKAKGIIATEARPPGTTRIEKAIGFGPLEPGKKDSKIVTLFLNKEADPKTITHDLSIKHPDGVKVESKVYGKGTKLAAEITISVDRDIQMPETFSLEKAYEGSIRFRSSEPGVEVLPIYIPIRITFNEDRVRWGRKMLPRTDMGQVKARRMTFEELTKQLAEGEKEQEEAAGPVATFLREIYKQATSRYIMLLALAAVVVIIAALLYRMRPASETFSGELVVIKDPTNSNMKNVNLKRVGSLHDKNILTVGSSPQADIRLNHDSVSAIHCRIGAKTIEHRPEISIHPIKGQAVKVNEIEQVEKAQLADKDLIGVGGFILLFSNPEAQKEVVARFVDGRTMRGTPVTWDIGTPSFELLRSDVGEAEETAEEITIVKFTDLKAIFFLRADSSPETAMPAEMINREELVEVTFSDGEKIEGYPLKDFSDSAGRFYVVPLEMPNVASVLIERTGVTNLERRKAPAEMEAEKSVGLLASLRKRKGASPTE